LATRATLSASRPVADRERDRGRAAAHQRIDALELEIDLAPEPGDEAFERNRRAQIGKQIELRDQLGQPRAAHHVLADRLQPRLEFGGHRRPDERFGHLLPFDEDGRRGAVQIGQ